MTQPPGWYGDPQDPTQQRWWDGWNWTDYRRPAAATAPYGQGFGYQPRVPSTPDGVPLSGWWRRVGARLLDGLILSVVSLPLTGYFLFNGMQVLWDHEKKAFEEAVEGGGQLNATLPSEWYKWMLPALVIGLAVGFVYEFFFLTRRGATPGKMVAGISVRLRDVPGPPPGSAVLKRWGFDAGLNLLSVIPLVGTLFSLAGLLNYLWPLWDDKKQALHDKIAATNVVRGPQHRRSTTETGSSGGELRRSYDIKPS